LNEIRSANTVASGISAAQISKTLDRNTADIVKRVPGVTIMDDRFIVVRGLADRYNTVWLNDAGAPSSETDKKSFSFDLLPSGVIDRILIFKTPSPELPGDFAGGMVKVYTSSMPDKNQISFGVQASSRSNSTGTNFNYNTPSSTDWLGYDDGQRELPSDIGPKLIHKNDSNASAVSKSFGNPWILKTKKTAPDARINLAVSNVIKLNKVKVGNTLGVSYSNLKTNLSVDRQRWDSASENYHFVDLQSANTVNTGLLDNAAVIFGNSKIEFKNFYSQIGRSFVTVRNSQFTPGDSENVSRSYIMGYESRATYASQLCGTHKSKDNKRKYDWTLGYTDLFKNMPALRSVTYNKLKEQDDSLFYVKTPAGGDLINGGGMYYAQLYEHVYSFNQNFTQKITISDRFKFDVNAGTYFEYKNRSFAARKFAYTIKPGALARKLGYLPINQIFVDSNVGPKDRYRIDEQTDPYDKYTGSNELLAGYVSVKVPVGQRINILGGVRYEYNVQSIDGYVSVDTIKLKLPTKFMLPSLNATFAINENSLVRLAYGKSLNRPEFRETAPVYFYDYEEKAENYGSLYPTTVGTDTLKVAQIQNFDARYEWYPAAGEMIQIGGYYKSFTDPILRVLVPGKNADSKAFTFINAKNAYCMGAEIDLRKNLAPLDQLFKTKFFSDFFLVGNLSVTQSEMNIDTARVKNQIPKTKMQGQSPYIVNVGLFYQNEKNGFQGSVLYNVFGPKMYAVGTINVGQQSIGEMPFKSLDVAVSKAFFSHYVLSLGVQNLLDSKVLFMQDINKDGKFDTTKDKEDKSVSPGRYFTIGLKVKF
jgi:hypothetical protein